MCSLAPINAIRVHNDAHLVATRMCIEGRTQPFFIQHLSFCKSVKFEGYWNVYICCDDLLRTLQCLYLPLSLPVLISEKHSFLTLYLKFMLMFSSSLLLISLQCFDLLLSLTQLLFQRRYSFLSLCYLLLQMD